MLTNDYLSKEFEIKKEILELCNAAEKESAYFFCEIEKIFEFNQMKVLKAMQESKLSDIHFAATTGYGYNDLGRDTVENIYARVFKGEDALVRPQIISGTHALTVALFGNLKTGDELVSPVGTPYDTLAGVIGIRKTRGSLTENGVIYKQCNLKPDGSVDYDKIKETITHKTKMVTIQRSKGYSWRHSLTIDEIGRLISFIRSINENIICMVDNCYGEFVETKEPIEVGADLVVGSLIKNPGGGLCPVGGYIVGKKELIENCAYRLTSPGLGKEVGPTLGITPSFLQGLFLAPQVVANSLKGAIFAAKIFEKLGYETLPKSNEARTDIVQAIKFGSAEKLIKFCQSIQKASPVDSFVVPVPWDMPGYDCPVIMAAGAFVQGSSIELSADAPIKEPYIAYLQGGLTWYHAKIGITIAVNDIMNCSLNNVNSMG